jgi:hypothetical protein
LQASVDSVKHSSNTFHHREFPPRHSALRIFLEHGIGMAIAFLKRITAQAIHATAQHS